VDAKLDTLARELTALTQRFTDLGAQLGDAARALEDAGAPPDDVLVADLAGARTRFLELRTDVLSAAEAASVPPKAEPESLTELEPLLAAIEGAIRLRAKTAALEESRHQVLAAVDRVLQIVHRDDPAFASLVGCHGKAQVLREQALALDDPETSEAEGVLASAQAFGDLLKMVESRDALDDERYARLEESVSKAFGRSLAVAVARGKLAFADEIVEAPPEPAPAPEPVLAAPLASAAPAVEMAPVIDAPPLLAPPPVEEPPVELSIEPPPPPPEPPSLAVEMPAVEVPDPETPTLDMPIVAMPTVQMPPVETPRLEPEPKSAPEPVIPPAPEPAVPAAPRVTAPAPV